MTVDSTSILITVYPPSPDHQNGPIRNYTISYQQQSLSDTGEQQPIVIHVSSAETYPLVKPSQIRVYSLQPFTHYTFSIFATNDAGSSPSGIASAMTDPAGMLCFNIIISTNLSLSNLRNSTNQLVAPSQPPQNVTGYAQNSTAILLFYFPPPSTDQNGIIASFIITIEGTPFDTQVDVINITVATPVYPLVTGDNYIFTQLHAYNTYSIKLTAVNSVGESTNSDSINITTLQSGTIFKFNTFSSEFASRFSDTDTDND